MSFTTETSAARKKTLRVYLIHHLDGRVTGMLLRTWDWFFDAPPPAAYGMSEDEVLAALEVMVAGLDEETDPLERYLWDEPFESRTIKVEVHPQSAVKKRAVIGKRKIPLELTYLTGKLASGGYRVMIPRFGWRFVVEDLSIAPAVLRQAIGTILLGEQPRGLFDFRMEGRELTRAFWPKGLAARLAEEPPPKDRFPTVRKVADELVERCARGKVGVILGDARALEAMAPLFTRDPPASILLVGPAGVGKTTWVNRLARRLMLAFRDQPNKDDEDEPPRLFSTTADRLLAGMKYLGMWQKRAHEVIEELSHEGHYLHVGALLPMLRAQPDGSSLADLFADVVRSGEVSLLAECTPAELEAAERRAASFVSLFQVVRLAEPSAAEMPALLAELELRKSKRVSLTPAAKKRLCLHLAMFRRDQAFPGKAFRFYDQLGQEAEAKGDPKAEAPAPRVLGPREVSEAFARFSGIPVELTADEIPATAGDLAGKLARRVIGQDHAAGVAARVLARFKAGMNDPERPLGTLLFVGPTGVGKTELAKALAETLFGDDARMIRLDMSEYMLPGSASRLLEAHAGSTSLCQKVRQEPLSLVLFDELEKADPEVFDLLLGVLGEGRLSDEEGRLVDFRMTLIVMTSNLGVADTRSVGFGGPGERPGEASVETSLAKVREHFRPELVNRIDHVVPFRSLGRADVLRIVDLELDKAKKRTGLVRRGLTLRVLPEARALLAELGYDPARGARPLKRVLEEQVITPIAARIAADAGLRDREIVVGADAGGRIALTSAGLGGADRAPHRD